MFACWRLLTGPLLLGRGGGFALAARPQVLGCSGVHFGLDDVAAAAVCLSQFAALCCPLCLCSGCTACVALQLADDLRAVRGKRAGQSCGVNLLLPVR